ncbi:hypothetical protein OCH7691_03821 [Oceanibacterium hippocampi]|uniref:Uncharacterized protein n=1 Tax=Oceanibacterium hippocampi TaxID=745714 RepID=A0A1Y5TW74_9PROT|nr:hypothetical protein OCH7691_03821 [Oceanibacterium hippocampi]
MPATDTAAEKPDAPATDTAAATPAPAKIDLEQLEDRLRNTDAIGFFTKLSLKNEVDDLLTEFGAYHKNKGPELASLKDRFDLLLLKVLTLLQDNDKKLSEDIVASRDQIFGLLSDPKQFAKL